MKPQNLLFPAALALLLSSAVVNRASAEDPRRYQVQSAIVEYRLSGAQTGTETLYFDRWGMRETK